MAALTGSHGGTPELGWWTRVQRHSSGWGTARVAGALIGFVNLVWDGGDHAFLLDPKVCADLQRRGVGTALVRRAADEARTAGCTCLHVDFEPHLRPFYLDACGFVETDAGLLRL